MSTFNAYLRLARISNLPTVWSNVLAASTIAGSLATNDLLFVMLAMSLLYTGGMFLNDAFDHDVDARERPHRPLPSGALSTKAVWAYGLGMLAAGVYVFALFGLRSALAGGALAVAIIVYDAWHKGNSLAPFIMGLCRALVYVGTIIAAGAALSSSAIAAAGALLAYVAGLTFAAKEESFDRVQSWWPLALLAFPVAHSLANGSPDGSTLLFAALAVVAIVVAIYRLRRRQSGDVGGAVTLLIAAIALNDAVVAAAAGNMHVALACVALFAITVLFQRVIPGT